MIALFEQGFDYNGKYSEIIVGFPHFFFFREMVFGGLLEKIGGFQRKLGIFGGGIIGENWRDLERRKDVVNKKNMLN